MPQVTEHFVCVLCGMHAPVERLDEGPYNLEAYQKILGGKIALSEQERERRKGLGIFHRGSAPGNLIYEQIPVPEEMKEKARRQLERIRKEIDTILSEG